MTGINQILLPVSLLFIVLSIAGRKQAIGGWLLYFYYWLFAVLFISLRNALQNPSVFRPSFGSGSVNHEALVLAVFPRLFVFVTVGVIAIILLAKREWVWVERLRITLVAGVIISGFSIWLDVRYFPKSTLYNAPRLIGLCFWMVYFFASKRVHHVFRTHDWNKLGQITTDS